MKPKFSDKEWVQIKSGKFKGIRGTVFGMDTDFDKREKTYFYTIFPYTAGGNRQRSLENSGLGLVINVKEQNLKEVI
jgi:hypothetical protein